MLTQKQKISMIIGATVMLIVKQSPAVMGDRFGDRIRALCSAIEDDMTDIDNMKIPPIDQADFIIAALEELLATVEKSEGTLH